MLEFTFCSQDSGLVRERNTKLVRWEKKPGPNCVKLNYDDSFGNIGMAGCGGIIKVS